MRVNKENFERKDKKDITEIITILQLNKETLVSLLTENPTRFAIQDGHPAKKAVRSNTQWLIDKFLPEESWKSLTNLANQREINELIEAGLMDRTERFRPKEILPMSDLIRKRKPKGPDTEMKM